MQAIVSYLLRMLPLCIMCISGLCAHALAALTQFACGADCKQRCGTRAACVCLYCFWSGFIRRRSASGGNVQGGINLVPFTVLTDTWQHEIQHGNTAYF